MTRLGIPSFHFAEEESIGQVTGGQASGHQVAGRQVTGGQASGHQVAGRQVTGGQASGHQVAGRHEIDQT